jgi:hypothetical protein
MTGRSSVPIDPAIVKQAKKDETTTCGIMAAATWLPEGKMTAAEQHFRCVVAVEASYRS